MKKLFAITTVLFFAVASKAQDLQTTVDYLKTRVKEVINGSKVNFKGGSKVLLSEVEFTSSETKSYYTFEERPSSEKYPYDDYSFEFSPGKITEISNLDMTTENCVVGVMKISFGSKSVIKRLGLRTDGYYRASEHNVYYVDSFIIYYIKDDPTAFERIKKALLKLKELSVEKKDPFAN
jgi:hypothetical protein